ncbi:MAG TPA: tRNA (adenosine(37)-N6)-threonylcarbamoyltransferase complex ATPase subunit type 1 TsaE [bacterium]|nr:tRNA (adenosine(37)-N6)-threonylcarbamoyltransferase complex ATPase subunit type 1 TsaE [bacterium]
MIDLGRRVSAGEEQTRDLAARLARRLKPGDAVALVGELGAGKTRFVQGLARGLGVPADVPITSPTFTLLAVHEQGRLPLYHFDLYRLSTCVDLDRIGAEEYLWGGGVSVIEWADRVPEALPDDCLWIEFVFVGEERRLIFRTNDERWRAPVEEL